MQCDLGLFDSHQRDVPASLYLEQCYENPQGPKRSIRHVYRRKVPRILGSWDPLPELEGLHVTYSCWIDALNTGHDAGEVLLDASLDRMIALLYPFQDRRRIPTFSVQNFGLVRLLECPDFARVEVVEAHVTQLIVEGTKRRKACGIHQVEPIVSSRRRDVSWPLSDGPLLYEISSFADPTLLALYDVTGVGFCSNLECVVALCSIGQGEVESDSKVFWVSPGPLSDLRYPTPFAERVVERIAERIAYQSKCVEKVTFSSAVGTNEKRQRPERYFAPRDALVVLQSHPLEEWRRDRHRDYTVLQAKPEVIRR